MKKEIKMKGEINWNFCSTILNLKKRQGQMKFRYCEKATKFKTLKLFSGVKRKWVIFSNFCDLLRINKQYR